MRTQTDAIRSLRRTLTCVWILLLATPFGVNAQDWSFDAKLLASDGAVSDWFGYSVSIWGDAALIGATGDDDNGGSSGSAYLFRNAGGLWTQEAKLIAGDGETGDSFGWSVAVVSDMALVGAYQHGIVPWGAGAAYLFRNVGEAWLQEAELLASDAEESDRFGYSVAISGSVALVGADSENNQVGAAYVFRDMGDGAWIEEAKLTPADGAPMWWFGTSVSLSGDAALIGAFGDWSLAASGSAYVFRKIGGVWVQEAKLVPSDVSDDFGWSVSLAGETALVGACRDSDNGYDSGAAYVFRRTGGVWMQEAKLLPNDGVTGDNFGYSVSVSGDTALIGAYRDDDSGSSAGAGYVFRRIDGTWIQSAKLLAPDGAANHYFGLSASLSGDTALLASPYDDDNGGGSGSAYVFGALTPAFPGDVDRDGDVDITDLALLLSAFGTCDGDADFNAAADFDASRCVNLGDLAVLLSNFGL